MNGILFSLFPAVGAACLLALTGAIQKNSNGSAGSLGSSSAQAPATSGSSLNRLQASSMLQPA